MYDSANEGMWAKFSDLPVGTSFTSRDVPGNVYIKESGNHCRCTDFNVDDDDLIEILHKRCDGIVYNVYKQIIPVEDNYDVLIYQRIERSTC